MTFDVERLVGVQTNMLERWELHRDEMTNHMDRLAKLAVLEKNYQLVSTTPHIVGT